MKSLDKIKRVGFSPTLSEKVKRNNKSLGFSIEKLYETLFQKLGFADCISTRDNFQHLDACKVDLINLPVLVQIKAGVQSDLDERAILKSMEIKLKKAFPHSDPIHLMPKMILHHRHKEKGMKKRGKFDSIVTIAFDDFIPLLLAYHKQQENDLQSNERTD